ncbi:uncharacterized protein LOC102354012 isoform X2 [Latimeria chalumnae]|uniref:uncharacterized protein LOC102354012 isoform X2 n=1 Tax=Latimeria chalumnae TaxID=7897 RepID=UPI0003C193FE|nr:PREDICTED: uncharacterized protein LOC102354012 isoform X2 [Latimeria chalumnae]|eukprot:XP_006008011.1 PREDICTED: uncharacterized protein LOC102354012 isoform X2 [Latimeria chalumnae]
MGRLNEHAKKRIIELREAGLSFRKIKKVLERDHIEVTAQAICMFLKRKKVGTLQGSDSSRPKVSSGSGSKGAPVSWEKEQLWNLMQENRIGLPKAGERHGSGNNQVGDRAAGPPTQHGGGKGNPELALPEDSKEGIKIISVTSLQNQEGPFSFPEGSAASLTPSKGDPQATSQATQPVSANGCSSTSVPSAPPQTSGRGRGYSMHLRNPTLMARKRLVERAILLKKKVNFQTGLASVSQSSVLPVSERNSSVGSMAQLPVPTIATPGNAMANHSRAQNGHMTSHHPVTAQHFLREGQTAGPVRTPTQLYIGNMDSSIGGVVKDVNIKPGLVPSGPTSREGFPGCSQAICPPPRPSLQLPAPAAGMKVIADKLDAVHSELQGLAKAFQALTERQGRLEQRQEQQQQMQQEILMALQQLNSTLNPGGGGGRGGSNGGGGAFNQNCMGYGTTGDAPATGQPLNNFRMELF